MKNLYLLALSAFLLLQGQVIASTTDSTPQTGIEQVIPNEENMSSQANGDNVSDQGNILPQEDEMSDQEEENTTPDQDASSDNSDVTSN